MEKLSSAQKTALGDFFAQWILSSSFSAVKRETQLENAKLTTICAVGSPYGKMNELVVSSASNNNDVTQKFTGKELDKGTNLYHFGARSYDADLGVWTTSDPAKQFPGAYYMYAGNGFNPINSIDPDGKTQVEIQLTGQGGKHVKGAVNTSIIFHLESLLSGDFNNAVFSKRSIEGGAQVGLGGSGVLSFGIAPGKPKLGSFTQNNSSITAAVKFGLKINRSIDLDNGDVGFSFGPALGLEGSIATTLEHGQVHKGLGAFTDFGDNNFTPDPTNCLNTCE